MWCLLRALGSVAARHYWLVADHIKIIVILQQCYQTLTVKIMGSPVNYSYIFTAVCNIYGRSLTTWLHNHGHF